MTATVDAYLARWQADQESVAPSAIIPSPYQQAAALLAERGITLERVPELLAKAAADHAGWQQGEHPGDAADAAGAEATYRELAWEQRSILARALLASKRLDEAAAAVSEMRRAVAAWPQGREEDRRQRGGAEQQLLAVQSQLAAAQGRPADAFAFAAAAQRAGDDDPALEERKSTAWRELGEAPRRWPR
ncbi:MAG TPA: hypothetical protein VGV61_17585 [Thermoanaerobaculia bacterium]|nr:hypothetical protein [Thermoanaerobaculia bacterium]